MCGFSGFLTAPRSDFLTDTGVIRLMSDAIIHRGPDDSGYWLDREAGVALGHRRLSILDLSPQGHQPMVSACQRYVIAFNGEIYNHRDLRVELESLEAAPAWRGHSDSEVMLAAFAHWGVEAALKKLTGMFAFALWDRQERSLILARDRIGEKPLYYGWMGDVFLFGSELKALRAHPAWRGEIDRDALALYLFHSGIPNPYSIYRGIRKLSPGTYLSLRVGQGEALPEPRPYWSARTVAESGVAQPFAGGEQEALTELDRLLRRAVRRQMAADVPLGAFLSGGYDSTTIVALMQAQSERPVKTFTIGFHESGYNEAEHAKAVARHLGTEHTEWYVTAEEAMAVIPSLPRLYDEPFADSSQIPTYLVSRLARQHVTVSLSGDGGDELFGGYNRYFWGRDLWRRLGWSPSSLRHAMASLLRTWPPQSGDKAFHRLGPLL
ncbi:MAG: asparagine synthase (glutamine-hydrolyzing), partial [Methylococcaceae bacterium]|nr:asparagine synthase (glutamine-hydrolyzing) [Methylococcaceae bacterium]